LKKNFEDEISEALNKEKIDPSRDCYLINFVNTPENIL